MLSTESPEPTEAAPRTSGSAAVLLVDDTPSNLLALQAVLRPLRARMVSATSGAEALAHVKQEPFAVALIDVQMPDMDGFQLARLLRMLEYGRKLPIMFVTAIHQDEVFVRRGYQVGAADYITKPYDPDIVLARVKTFVELYEQRQADQLGQLTLMSERDEALRRLVAFERIASAALETSDLQALLHELLQAFTEAADATDSATIFLCVGDSIEVKASTGLGEAMAAGFRLPIGRGFAGTIAAEKRALELSDASNSVLVESPWIRESKVRGLYGVPLLHHGRVLGVAHIGSSRSSSFSEAERRLFRAAADRAALAVARHLELSVLYDVLSSVPGFIAIVRAKSLDYLFTNAAYRSLFAGELGDTLVGDQGLGPRALEAVERAWRSGEPVQIEEMPVGYSTSSPEDYDRYARFTAQPLGDSFGEIDRVMIFGIDITAQVLARKNTEAIQAARAELLQRERAARKAAEAASVSKDEFLATVSHELRTPLSAIIGWVAVAKAGPVPDMARVLSVIERNALAQARIIEDILDFSRIERGQMRLNLGEVSVSAVITEALETVKPAAEAKGVVLSAELALTSSAWGDAQRLQQVVWNLLTNGIKFTASGGRVVVRASNTDTALVISVSDTGQGIEPEFVPHVFDPFRQAQGGTTRRHGGLGLGLAIVKHIVQAHGGTIHAESAGLGQGTTLTLELPLVLNASVVDSVPAPAATERPSSDSQRANLAGVRILIVDDDEDGREFLAQALGQRGAQTARASGVAQALLELARFKPHVLLSDIAMPDTDGFELMRRIRALPLELGGTVPAIAVTAHTRRETLEQARLAGFQTLEPKPIDLDHLTETVAELAHLRREEAVEVSTSNA